MSAQDSFDITELSNGKGAAAVLERAAEPPVLMTQRMPVRWQWVELTDDWAGWRAEMHMNPPMSLLLQIQNEGVLVAMPKLIRAWNFGDPEGNPLPLTPEGMAALPDDLLTALAAAYQATRGLPKATNAT